MPDTPIALLNTDEVASMLRVSRQTVHRWTVEGKLTPIDYPGRDFRFRRADIEALLEPRVAAS